MRILKVQLFSILAVTGLLASAITDVSAGEKTTAKTGGAQQVSHEYYGDGYSYNCPPGYDGGGTYRYYSSREGKAFLRKCHTSPGHGWCPPSAQSIERIPVQYQRYYSNRYMGMPGPMGPANYQQIYMPTDTTQLGFYYQVVPTWQPRRGMIPPPPNPNMYHTRDCSACRGRGCKHCRGQYFGGPVYYSTGSQTTPEPEPAPKKEEGGAPAVPPEPSKLNQASFEK